MAKTPTNSKKFNVSNRNKLWRARSLLVVVLLLLVWQQPSGLHAPDCRLQSKCPVSPVGAALAVDDIRRPQRPVCTQFSCAAVDERAICKDHLIPISSRDTCNNK